MQIADEGSKEEEQGMREVSDDELLELGMHDLVAQRREILAKKHGKRVEVDEGPETACGLCRQTMLHMQREFDDEAVRTYEEVEFYLDEMCDDMEGWYKPEVVQWCRENLLTKKQMVNGLVQMFPGNLVESVCALGLKICTKDSAPDPMFEKIEEGEEVALETPATGCLKGLGSLGVVKKVGLVANEKQYLVEAHDGSCESWYAEGVVARRNVSEAFRKVHNGTDSDAVADAPPSPPPAPPPPPPAEEELSYKEIRKVVAAKAKARRRALARVEEAEKALRKAERRLGQAQEDYDAAAGRLALAEQKRAADDTVVATATATAKDL